MTLAPQIENILEKMGRMEMEIARLYRLYALQFPASAAFWTKLSGEEIGHAASLRELADSSRRGEITVVPDRFNAAAVQMVLNSIAGHIRDVGDGRVSILNALSIAQVLESSLLEKEFFSVFRTDAAGTRSVLEKLAEDTQRHRMEIQAEWRAAGGGMGH